MTTTITDPAEDLEQARRGPRGKHHTLRDLWDAARPGGWQERAACAGIPHFLNNPEEAGYGGLPRLCGEPGEPDYDTERGRHRIRVETCAVCPVIAYCARDSDGPEFGPFLPGRSGR